MKKKSFWKNLKHAAASTVFKSISIVVVHVKRGPILLKHCPFKKPESSLSLLCVNTRLPGQCDEVSVRDGGGECDRGEEGQHAGQGNSVNVFNYQ